MGKTVQDIMKLIRKKNIRMLDFKMVDINGQYHHVSIPAENFSEETMESGIGFDVSNYGYAVVEKSDMVYIPDPDTAMVDPFCEIPTLTMVGNAMIIDNPENRPLPQYPRNIIRAAVQHMKDSGVADTMLILPEFKFYLFDEVTWRGRQLCRCTDRCKAVLPEQHGRRQGGVVPKQKNYHIAKPVDVSYECRNEMCLLMKDGQSVFSDDNGYAHLSETAHYFMGGLLKHILSLCAFTNPGTSSFKRLVPGFEAPVTVGYATFNRRWRLPEETDRKLH